MLKPKSVYADLLKGKNPFVLGVGLLSLVVLIYMLVINKSSSLTASADASTSGTTKGEGRSSKPLPVRIHPVNQIVPANAFSGALKKPLEGKNTQCGKVSAEYRFKVANAGDYFLYVQVIAPGLNDNSLWVGLIEGADQDAFDACETPSGITPGPFLPHKHLSSKKFLCCPAYLAKNKKKGLAGFYSDCCYSGLGKDSNEKGCVLDLEVDDQQRWNQLPRVIRTSDDDQIVVIRIYAREDGTSWTNVVLSSDAALDDKSISKLKKYAA